MDNRGLKMAVVARTQEKGRTDSGKYKDVRAMLFTLKTPRGGFGRLFVDQFSVKKRGEQKIQNLECCMI